MGQVQMERAEGPLLLSVAGIPQRIESTRPRCYPSFVCETNKCRRPEHAGGDHSEKQKILELLRRDMGTN
jgi:hypothetical protein